uniref:Uncharacterized protein n=1 Tax=Plectus sambesii TaxID=2011161 RepID=A0A914XBL1_9BILA
MVVRFEWSAHDQRPRRRLLASFCADRPLRAEQGERSFRARGVAVVVAVDRPADSLISCRPERREGRHCVGHPLRRFCTRPTSSRAFRHSLCQRARPWRISLLSRSLSFSVCTYAAMRSHFWRCSLARFVMRPSVGPHVDGGDGGMRHRHTPPSTCPVHRRTRTDWTAELNRWPITRARIGLRVIGKGRTGLLKEE